MIARAGPEIGESFGPYRIEGVLGRGGMGTVYLATHERLARKAAIKVIAAQYAHDDDFRARFLVESQLAASLDHPNVIPIFDAGEIDGLLYLAMRYVPGRSLYALLEERGPLPVEHVVAIAEHIGGALDAAHGAGLLHRDVKPANILVTEPGGHLYLCDFGLAKRTSSRGATQTGSFFGTVDYAAPEQIQGLPLDGRVDVYALGCVLFHCLAGRPPFERGSDFLVLQAHLADRPPSLSEIVPGLPAALDAAIGTALAKRPADRYASASDLADELRHAAAGKGTDQTTRRAPAPRGRTPEPSPFPARTRKIAAVAAAAAVALVAVVAAVVIATHRGRGHASGASPAALSTFVDRVQNVLVQSSGGRREIGAALAAGLACTIAPREAGRRIASVTENRQSILDQLGSLQAPTPQAATVGTLLQRALQQSIEADRHYRDAFFATTRKKCPLTPSRDFTLAATSDASATAAKERFVAAFNPIARRFHRRTWLASEF
ncbi:MAG TPA: serine/threonine-protein kinase [Gaiellaceae bacterium]|nr:serine/threonine-protein kinase [Gaiellaceae bacterium]